MRLVIGPEAITSYRRLDYSPWHALAEFVDNSTQSYFDNRSTLDEQLKNDPEGVLTVSIVYDRDNGTLRVVDNAMGMSRVELEHALHVARPPRNTDGRSKYGMGMKTAACWIGNSWTIKTKRLGEGFEHSVTIDVDRVATSADGAVRYSKLQKEHDLHYTMIEISDLNRKFQGRTVGKIKDFLRSMYRVDLRENQLCLRWQDERLSWDDVESAIFSARDGKKYRKDFSFNVDGVNVHGWVGILAKGSRAKAGFSIMQARRVVRGWPDAWRPSSLYGQFQGSNDLINQRLFGEIHLDGFDVSHTKDNILWRDNQEEDVEERLREHCSDYREFARTHRHRGGDERGPATVDVKTALDELKSELSSPEMVDQINISDVPPKEAIEASSEKIINSVVGTQDATLRGTINSNPSVNWSIFLENMSPNDPYVVSDSTKSSEVTVIVNQAHPYWIRELRGPDSILDYLRQCVYDSVAEWQARSKVAAIDPETVKMLKDRLLRVRMEMESHD